MKYYLQMVVSSHLISHSFSFWSNDIVLRVPPLGNILLGFPLTQTLTTVWVSHLPATPLVTHGLSTSWGSIGAGSWALKEGAG